MPKTLSLLAGLFISVLATGAITGCGNDIKTVKTVETQEQEPVRMVSPGTEVVE